MGNWRSQIIMQDSPATVASIVAMLRASSATDRELAVNIHNHVRDEIPFGFTGRHDKADANYTLQRKTGHCTPKSDLFCTLLRQAGFHDATLVTVPIGGNVLHHLGANESSPFPSRLQHSFTEVTVEGRKCRVDSYIIDAPLFRGAQKKLQAKQHLEAGYGIHAQGRIDWNGQEDSFVQYVASTQRPDLERRFQSIKQVVGMTGYLHSDLMTLLAIPVVNWGVSRFLESTHDQIEAIRNV